MSTAIETLTKIRTQLNTSFDKRDADDDAHQIARAKKLARTRILLALLAADCGVCEIEKDSFSVPVEPCRPKTIYRRLGFSVKFEIDEERDPQKKHDVFIKVSANIPTGNIMLTYDPLIDGWEVSPVFEDGPFVFRTFEADARMVFLSRLFNAMLARSRG